MPPPFTAGASLRVDPLRGGSTAAEEISQGGERGARGQGLLPSVHWDWRHAIAGLLLGFGPSILLTTLGTGSTSAGQSAGEISAATAAALLVTSALMYVWQVGSAWFFSLRGTNDGLGAWGFRKPTLAYFWVIPLSLITVYVVAFIHNLLVNPEQQALLDHFPRTPAGIALLAILAVVMAPLFEELFFRGFLFRGLARSWGWPLGAVVSSAVFGAAHMQLTVFVPLFALGFVLAWTYERTGSLWTPISLHAIFNGISVLAWALM